MDIRSNIEYITGRIREAAELSGRKAGDIKIVAVTKTVDVESIRQAFELGISSIGENRVQEMLKKHENLKQYPLEWHMIGHLQRNKVKYIIDKVALIHSVDTAALAREINRRAIQKNIKAEVLLQVNVSGEESKFGLNPDQITVFMEQVKDLHNIHIRGLMTIAPYTDNPEEARPVFAKLREVFEGIRAAKYPGVDMDFLSMGMTGDYAVAVEEGANIVRIGTGIFGRRRM
jgi:hypothetical protein